MKMRHKRKPDIRKRLGIGFVFTGFVLVVSVAVIFAINGLENRMAGRKAELLLYDIQAAVENGQKNTSTEKHTNEVGQAEASDDVSLPEQTEVEESPVPKAPAAISMDYACIGYLSLPGLQLELPVIAEWDYERLNTAPCRHFGSAATGDLVIAGHDYKTHFGRIPELKTGDTVYFTDMDGVGYIYSVAKSPAVISADAVDAVQHSDHDLVLYTCTVNGKKRIAVYCDLVV